MQQQSAEELLYLKQHERDLSELTPRIAGDYFGMESSEEWGGSPRRAAKAGDPGSYVDDEATFYNIIRAMHGSKRYELTKDRGTEWGLKSWGSKARKAGRSVFGWGTAPRTWYQPAQALWKHPKPAIGHGIKKREMAGPIVDVYNRFRREHGNAPPLRNLVVRYKPAALGQQNVPKWAKRLSEGKLKVLREMLDEQTGYGNVTYGAEGRSVGRTMTSLTQMKKYVRTFGSPREQRRLEGGLMNGSEMHTINRRIAGHYGMLLKHLDKVSGKLPSGTSRALRGLAKLLHHKGTRAPIVIADDMPVPAAPIQPIIIPDGAGRQVSENRVSMHKVDRTKGVPAGSLSRHRSLSRTPEDVGVLLPDVLLQGADTVAPPDYVAPGPPQPTEARPKKRKRVDISELKKEAGRQAAARRVKRERMGSVSSMRRSSRSVSSSMESLWEEPPAAISIPAQVRQQSLITQPSASGLTEHTSYTHLIEGDLAPVGRVHLVALGPDTGDQREQHILTQMDADANMGAQNLRVRSRRGPFRTSTGRSRVMDRTAHVAYRRRGHAIEIAVRRGVTDSEMETLIGKLSAHRIASQKADLYLIIGSRKKMGDLDRIDMEKLRDKIYRELEKRATIGLLLQDVHTKGLLHKGYSHSMSFKENNKMMQGLLAK